jgi:2-polyprenyl-3-methyl-5-hydroxy-6-metoxy-1,4-benzoquinol methylase
MGTQLIPATTDSSEACGSRCSGRALSRSAELRSTKRTAALRVLVAIASYGKNNDAYLVQIIDAYRRMAFDVDIVVLSNIAKAFGSDVQTIVGLPSSNPWSLPFAHKSLFSKRLENYDLFVYSEDDILLTERNLNAFLSITPILRDTEIAGFLRFERGADGATYYPDVHAHFHWDACSVRSRGEYRLARLSNDHAACYALTQTQLRKAIRSGGFCVPPHEYRYDLLCAAATDPYTQCGFSKLIAFSHMEDFTVHHLSNKYAGTYGIREGQMRMQVNVLHDIASGSRPASALFETETKLWHFRFSKDYYEAASEDLLSMVPHEAGAILSVGCGSGEIEGQLIARGSHVVAIPLDSVIGSGAEARGVELVEGDLTRAAEQLSGREFDVILYSNVLQLLRDPAGVLKLFARNLRSTGFVLIRTPNLLGAPTLRTIVRRVSLRELLFGFDARGMHFTWAGRVRAWCRASGMRVNTAEICWPSPATFNSGRRKGLLPFVAPEVIVRARPLPDQRSMVDDSGH